MRVRILVLSLVITIVSIILFSLASAQVYYESSISEGETHLITYMSVYESGDYEISEEGCRELSSALNGTRVTFIAMDGEVIADSAADGITENHSDRSEVKSAISSGEGFAVRSSATMGESMLYYCKDEGGVLVRISIAEPSSWGIFLKAMPTTAIYIGIDIILCIILAFVATHFIVTPVRDLARNAAGKGNVVSKYPELKPVADALNERSRVMENQMERIVKEKEAAERAQASKDEFIANVSHEMNTPITSIRGYAELLESGALDEEQTKEAYKIVKSQSERLTSLMASIINYGEIDDDLPESEVDVSEVVREIVEALRPEAEKREIEIVENIEDNVKVTAREEHVSELAGNLVRNAIRYNRDGGEIEVSLSYGTLKVRDTGVGIAEEDLDKIFDRFYTADRSHGENGGFGLGLAVVKKICSRYGWKISAESALGEGSVFAVEF